MRVLAIAGLAMRTAIRSRLFITLVSILAIVVVSLPLTIKGDGTLRGQIALLLFYSLGLTGIILGVAALWTTCWTISREVDEKYIQMIMVKPVRCWHLWIGKWLGTLFMNAILLFLASLAIYAGIVLKINNSGADQVQVDAVKDELMNCRAVVTPQPLDYSEAAHLLLDRMIERGFISADLPHNQAYQQAYKQHVASTKAVAPGQTKSWSFDVSRLDIKPDSDLQIRYYLSLYVRERNSISGVWRLGTDTVPILFEHRVNDILNDEYVIPVPAEKFAGAKMLRLSFTNAEREKSNVAVFKSDEDVKFMVRTSSFGANYARSAVVIFCQLALVSALGLMFSALFSFPVAVFGAISVFVISIMAHYFVLSSQTTVPHVCSHGHHHEEPGIIEKGTAAVVTFADKAIAPALGYQPLPLLSDGYMVSWSNTFKAVGVLLILYPGIMGITGAFFLSRRELALPSD